MFWSSDRYSYHIYHNSIPMNTTKRDTLIRPRFTFQPPFKSSGPPISLANIAPQPMSGAVPSCLIHPDVGEGKILQLFLRLRFLGTDHQHRHIGTAHHTIRDAAHQPSAQYRLPACAHHNQVHLIGFRILDNLIVWASLDGNHLHSDATFLQAGCDAIQILSCKTLPPPPWPSLKLLLLLSRYLVM